MSDAITRSRLLIGGLLVAFLGALARVVGLRRARAPGPGRQLPAGGAPARRRRPRRARARSRATTSSPRSARSSTRWPSSSRRTSTRSSASGASSRTRSGGSARRSGPASTARGWSTSPCGRRSRRATPDGGRLVPVDPRELDEVRLADDPALLQGARGGGAPGVRFLDEPAQPSPPTAYGRRARARRCRWSARHDEQGECETSGAISIARRGGDFTSSSATCSPT